MRDPKRRLITELTAVASHDFHAWRRALRGEEKRASRLLHGAANSQDKKYRWQKSTNHFGLVPHISRPIL
jgi:hypothetical protein